MILFPEAGIDGEALNELVSDFEEFSALVTAPLARIRIKKFVKTMNSASEKREANSDEVHVYILFQYLPVYTNDFRKVPSKRPWALDLSFAISSWGHLLRYSTLQKILE